ncbi:MAG: PAS domain-containing sensor histidine kinase [Proteobacteria bacterium]|nr:PAS domain-containing sensor histidine kinase [Pseudomonadota bacterium]
MNQNFQVISSSPDQLYQMIIDLLPCYISIQNNDLEILYTNKSFLNDFGEATGRKCHDVLKCSAFMCGECPVKKSFEDNAIHFGEDSVLTREGAPIQLLVYAVPIPAGRDRSVIEFSIDISKIKNTQKELALLGRSVALISHGIKNLLEGLHGGEYVVDEGLREENWPLVEKGWKVVKNNIIDISMIAQNILYSSKKKALTIEKVKPGEMVKRVVSMLNEKALSMGVSLRAEVNPYLPEARLDQFTIKKMLINLISNALEACERDREKNNHFVVARALAYNELQYKFEVEDNGIGMDEDMRKKIFQEFFSTRGTSGTGLGLSVVETIVKEHQGKIEVESVPGQKSLFRIIFTY